MFVFGTRFVYASLLSIRLARFVAAQVCGDVRVKRGVTVLPGARGWVQAILAEALAIGDVRGAVCGGEEGGASGSRAWVARRDGLQLGFVRTPDRGR